MCFEKIVSISVFFGVLTTAQLPDWVDDEEYPLSRGRIDGTIKGQTKAMIVAHSSLEENFDLQTLGYLYHNQTNEDGRFILLNVRPGNYILTAYPLAGQGSENLAQTDVIVIGGAITILSPLELPEPTEILWSIGETNRRSDTFRYSDEKRNFYWHTLPPANLTYTIGKSNPTKDWYYAQTHKGIWNIIYSDVNDNKPRTLRLGIAAATGSLIFNVSTIHLQVDVNGYLVGDFEYENDKAIYRDALQSGNYYAEKMTVPAEKVLTGENVVSLQILEGNVMYDAISMAKDS